jgi:hypothetical protein
MPNLSSYKVRFPFARLKGFHSTLKPTRNPERVADDPWKLLVAVTLLNKTSGRCAVPIFWTLIDRWPTPQSLAKGQPLLSSILGVVNDIITS